MNYLLLISLLLILLIYIIIQFGKQKLRKKNIIINKYNLSNNYDIYKTIISRKQNEYIKQPTEITLMKDLIKEFNNDNTKWINLIKIGDIYTKGLYPIYKPNKYLGLKCFQIAMISPDNNISNLAKMKFQENKYNNIYLDDINGQDLPIKYGNEICNLAKNYLENIKLNLNNNNNNTLFEIDLNNNNDNNIIIEIDNNDNNEIDNNDNNEIYINDLQNVHDHSVNNIIKTNIELLKQNYNINNITNEYIINIIIEKIYEKTNIDEQVRFNAIEVLHSLNNINHTTFNISEIDSLKYIYKYIENNTNKDNLYHILILELSNCIENGFIICNTGKISRIISILDGLDDKYNQIKNIYTIKEEIQNLANKIREQILKESNELDKQNYINDADDKLSNLMINELEKKVNEIYYKKLNLNKEILKPIIEENIIGF
jgi:hypothetical protein